MSWRSLTKIAGSGYGSESGSISPRYGSTTLISGLAPKNCTEEKSCCGTKVLTSEKIGGLKVVACDRSPFKLFKLRFSNKSVQAPSCKRPETTQRSLFLSFEINNCFPITSEAYEKIRENYMPRGQFKHRYWFFADTPNIAGNCCVICKIYNEEPIRFLPSSQTLCRIYNTVFFS